MPVFISLESEILEAILALVGFFSRVDFQMIVHIATIFAIVTAFDAIHNLILTECLGIEKLVYRITIGRLNDSS